MSKPGPLSHADCRVRQRRDGNMGPLINGESEIGQKIHLLLLQIDIYCTYTSNSICPWLFSGYHFFFSL